VAVEHGGGEAGAICCGGGSVLVSTLSTVASVTVGEQVLAFVLGELVLVEGEELLGVAGVDALVDRGQVDRSGDVEQAGDAGGVDDEHAVEGAAGDRLVHLGHHAAHAGHVGGDGGVAPVLAADVPSRCAPAP
jgi:hypothetical protein